MRERKIKRKAAIVEGIMFALCACTAILVGCVFMQMLVAVALCKDLVAIIETAVCMILGLVSHEFWNYAMILHPARKKKRTRKSITWESKGGKAYGKSYM